MVAYYDVLAGIYKPRLKWQNYCEKKNNEDRPLELFLFFLLGIQHVIPHIIRNSPDTLASPNIPNPWQKIFKHQSIIQR